MNENEELRGHIAVCPDCQLFADGLRSVFPDLLAEVLGEGPTAYPTNDDEIGALFARLSLPKPTEADGADMVWTTVLHKILDRLDALEAR